jgi:acyl-CoA synthetase (NDP forming)
MSSFDSLFKPRIVAVIGASTNATAIGSQVVANLLHHNFSGQIYPINPKYEVINGLRSYSSIEELPATPDLLVIAIAARFVLETIAAAGRRGIKFALILSSGFAETGETGHAVQKQLQDLAQKEGVRLIGPNCQGLMNITDSVHIGFGTPYVLNYLPGRVSLVSQSGAFGNCLIMGLDSVKVGLRRYISTGNEAATTSLDCIDDLLDDAQTHVVAGYLEGYRDANRLMKIGIKALRLDKPIVLWKVGNSVAGARAAASHTANLAGGAGLYYSAFRQFGIVSVNDIDEMADCVRALSSGRRTAGNRVGVVTISGGAGIVLVDKCSELGLDIPVFCANTIEELRPKLPEFASLANPLDVTAGAINDPDGLVVALELVVNDPSVDMLALALASISGKAGKVAALAIATLSIKTKIPILVAWNAPSSHNAEAYSILADAGIPVYSSPVRCARGLGAIWEFSSARIRESTNKVALNVSKVPIQFGRSYKGLLNEFDSKKVLQAYGLSTTAEAVVGDVEVAVEFADKVGYPVVMKLLSADLPHKSDIGGVQIGLTSESLLRQAYLTLQNVASLHESSSRIEGVLVQEMVRGGVEVILGAVVDPSFGPMVMFGSGGTHAEVLNDVTFRMAPFNHADAQAMIEETRAFKLLQGIRGAPRADIESLINALLIIGRLIVEHQDELIDIDINPLFVLPAGQGICVVDAVIRFRKA